MLSQINQIYLVGTPLDMRKSINGLAIFINSNLQQNPTCGAGFVFYNQQKDKIKILYYDHNGFVLFYKRFEKKRINLPKLPSNMTPINYVQLLALLAGLEIGNLAIPDKIIYSEF